VDPQACLGSASCLLSIPFSLHFVDLVCVRMEPVPTDRVLLGWDTYIGEQKAAWTEQFPKYPETDQALSYLTVR